MKFDVLIKELLNETIDSRGGHMSIENSLSNLDTENNVDDFVKTSDPHFLIYPLMVASEFKYKDKKIKVGKEYLSGMSFVKKIKDIFFTETSPNYINLPGIKGGVVKGKVPTQEYFRRQAIKIGEAKRKKDQKFLDQYKEFSKTPEQYPTWGQLLSLIYLSKDMEVANRTQRTDTIGRYAKYINAEGNETHYSFHTDENGIITNDPFGDSMEFRRPHIRPQAVGGMDYKQFKDDIKERGNTFDALLEVIDGQEGRAAKKTKTPSLIQRMTAQRSGES